MVLISCRTTSRARCGPPVSVVFSTGDTTFARIFAYQSDPAADAYYDDFSLTVL